MENKDDKPKTEVDKFTKEILEKPGIKKYKNNRNNKR